MSKKNVGKIGPFLEIKNDKNSWNVLYIPKKGEWEIENDKIKKDFFYNLFSSIYDNNNFSIISSKISLPKGSESEKNKYKSFEYIKYFLYLGNVLSFSDKNGNIEIDFKKWLEAELKTLLSHINNNAQKEIIKILINNISKHSFNIKLENKINIQDLLDIKKYEENLKTLEKISKAISEKANKIITNYVNKVLKNYKSEEEKKAFKNLLIESFAKNRLWVSVDFGLDFLFKYGDEEIKKIIVDKILEIKIDKELFFSKIKIEAPIDYTDDEGVVYGMANVEIRKPKGKRGLVIEYPTGEIEISSLEKIEKNIGSRRFVKIFKDMVEKIKNNKYIIEKMKKTNFSDIFYPDLNNLEKNNLTDTNDFRP